MPIMETERLILREMTTDDLPALREIVQDDQTMLAWNGAWSEDETVEGLEKQLASYRENGFGRWAVILKETGVLIGMCGLQWIDTDTDTVLEIGYLFNRAYWHNGYASEAAIACKIYAFDVLKHDEVFSLIRDSNFASMNVAIRTGMTVRGRYTKHYKGEDMLHYIFSVRIGGTMKIRKMLISDYSSVYSLWLNTPGVGLNTIDDSEIGIGKYLRRNPNTCFVAEKDSEIIGVILSGHDGRRGLIYHLAVKFSEREQGIGSKLLECALDALENDGISKVYIMVFKNNETGNAFWEKRGFSIPDESLYRAKEIVLIEHIDI